MNLFLREAVNSKGDYVKRRSCLESTLQSEVKLETVINIGQN